MKPREILQNAIEEYMVEPFKDLGFEFYKSSTKFKKVIEDYIQEIEFSTSKWNKEGLCDFHAIINIRSKSIRKFVKNITGEYPHHNIIYSIYDVHNEEFSNFVGGAWYELNESNYATEMKKYVDKFIDVLVPVIDSYTNYDKCLKRMVDRNHVDLGIYLAEMIGDRESSSRLIKYLYSRANEDYNLNKTNDLKLADFLNEKFQIL